MRTGQWITSGDGVRWFFDSGSLALDFAYTGDYGYGVPEWERLHGPEDLGAWLEERFGPRIDAPNDTELTASLQLRASISRIALALADDEHPSASDIDVINHVALAPAPVPHLDGGTTPPRQIGVPAILSAIARDAIEIFSVGAERIRRCGADDCALVFYDTSRPGTRRWCSMRRCGNRAKVRTHRSRTREEQS